MPSNRALVYAGPGVVELCDLPYPELRAKRRLCDHGVIVKVLLSGIGGEDLHILRGKTAAKPGLVLGREITGEVVETGSAVEFIRSGDLVSVPFNVACGSCRNCRSGDTGICLTVNRWPGGAFGAADMGGWPGGQAGYVMCPYADFNLVKFPDKRLALEKIRDLCLLSDVLPTGVHAAQMAGVCPGSVVYVAGAGAVGLAAALCSLQLMGAGRVIVGDPNPERLALARKMGCATVDVDDPDSVPDQVEGIVGEPLVDSVVDAVGYEARERGEDRPDAVLRLAVRLARAGGGIALAGEYNADNPAAGSERLRHNVFRFPWGEAWGKALTLRGGQCPVGRYSRPLRDAVLCGRLRPAEALHVRVVPMEEGPRRYQEFEQGAPEKFVLDPHGAILGNEPIDKEDL